MAAEMAARSGFDVTVFDAMPSVGRKFLLAGKGGLNLTHAEPFDAFIQRYGAEAPVLRPLLEDFGPDALRDWASDLGIETFVGSSFRVFPKEMKAAPLLRNWIRRLRSLKVRFALRHYWSGWSTDGALLFTTPEGPCKYAFNATILCLGGGSWPHLGSDGRWVDTLRKNDIAVRPLEPSNSGFTVAWTESFRQRFAGTPVKTVKATVGQGENKEVRKGEFVITENGVEGSLIYALSRFIRTEINHNGKATLLLDLVPDRDVSRLQTDLCKRRGKASLSTHLRKNAGLSDVKIGLLRECVQQPLESEELALTIKSLPCTLERPFPIDKAISSAGGVSMTSLDENLMVKERPGLFLAGEMLDWDAPTGGYLLTAAFSTGYRAGCGAAEWLGTVTDQESASHPC